MQHACGLRTDGTIRCWGRNISGETDAPDGQFTAVAAGSGQSCAVRIDGTATCWGSNTYGQLDAPDGRFTSVTAGLNFSCGLRTDGHYHLLGREFHHVHGRAERRIRLDRHRLGSLVRIAHRRDRRLLGPRLSRSDGRAKRSVHRRDRRGSDSLVRVAYRRHHQVLGPQRLPVDECAGWRIHVHHHDVWTAPRSHHRMLGREQLRTGRRTQRTIHRHRGRRRVIRVHWVPTGRSPAGATTSAGRRTRPKDSSTPSPSARITHAHCAPTAPLCAGEATHDGESDPPDGQFIAVSSGFLQLVRIANQPQHRMLEHKRARNDGRAGRTIHHRRHR